MQEVINWIQQNIGITPDLQSKLLTTLVALLILVLVRRMVLLFVYRQTDDTAVRYHWRKTSGYVSFGSGILIFGSIWFSGFQSFTTYLGLVSAGIAIALQAPLVNLAAWFFILWRKPFSVGDRIQIGDVRGDVIDQRLFMFSLMEIGNWVDAEQSTGRVVHVPNGKIFSEPLANYMEGFQFIWNEIPVLVTFESNWKKAKKILVEITENEDEELTENAETELRIAAGKMMIYLNKLTPIVYTSVKDSGIMLTIRYLCDPRRRRTSEQEIWEQILDAFSENQDIDFAYPTERRFLNYIEGKSATEEARQKT